MVSAAMGHRFPSPFATPPGRGLSSARVNMLWGFFNLAAAYFFLCKMAHFDPGSTAQLLSFALGLLLFGLVSAQHFGGLNGGNGPDRA